MKERELKFIKDFNQINVKKICEEFGINPKNVYSGKTSIQNMANVYYELQYKIRKLLLDDEFWYRNTIIKDRKIEVLEDKENA